MARERDAFKTARARQEPEGPDERPPDLDLRPVRVEKTFVSVANEIKRLIFSGSLKPGDRLPPELELAERLGVSRPSVREALRVLELSGFLQVQGGGGGGGRIIVDTIAASIGNSLLDAVQMGNVTTEELTTARIEMERVIVRHAVERAEDEDIRLLRANIAGAYRKITAGEWAADDNIQFHKLLAKAAKNHVLSTLMEALMLMLRASMERLRLLPTADKSRAFTSAHEGILDALVARDVGLAVRRMEAHLLEVNPRLQDASTDACRADPVRGPAGPAELPTPPRRRRR